MADLEKNPIPWRKLRNADLSINPTYRVADLYKDILHRKYPDLANSTDYLRTPVQ